MMDTQAPAAGWVAAAAAGGWNHVKGTGIY